MQNYSTLENHVKTWPIELESESESDMKHETGFSGPIVREETPQIPTKIQQMKKQRMEDSLQDG